MYRRSPHQQPYPTPHMIIAAWWWGAAAAVLLGGGASGVHLKSDDAVFSNAPSPPCAGGLRLQNEAVTAVFDGCRGRLSVLQRRGSPNLLRGFTAAPDHGPFAIWVNEQPPWLATNALNHSTSNAHACSGASGGCIALPRNGSGALTAAACRVVSHSLAHSNSTPMLTMEMRPKEASLPLRITLSATFAGPDPNDPRLRLTLQVANTWANELSLQLAFPFLRGVQLGANGSSDLGIRHQEVGIPGFAAWGSCDRGSPVGVSELPGAFTHDSCGGMLGFHTSSLWQQVYTPELSRGLAVISEDASGKARMIGRFGDGPAASPSSSGAIYSIAYPGQQLSAGASTAPAAALVVHHAGGWRNGATVYRDWLRSVGVGQAPRNRWFLEQTHSKGSCAFPPPAVVAASKQSGKGITSFVQTLEHAWGNGSVVTSSVDMMECAGATSGLTELREDLGGAAAMRAGMERIHASGRRLQLYTTGDVVHKGDPLFNSSWPASRWAQWWGRDGPDQLNMNGGSKSSKLSLRLLRGPETLLRRHGLSGSILPVSQFSSVAAGGGRYGRADDCRHRLRRLAT